MSFGIYKRGQGRYTRLCSGLGFGIVVLLGCLILYRKLEGADYGLWVSTMVPVGLFIVCAIGTAILLNWPAFADFLISAEGELKKVSWSSRKEITVSTFIVIVVVVIMAGLLGVTDLVFAMFFQWLLG